MDRLSGIETIEPLPHTHVVPDLSGLTDDERSRAGAAAVLADDDPELAFERLVPDLLHDKTLLAAMAHLEHAGADLSTFTVSAALLGSLYPINAFMPPVPEVVPGRVALTGLRARLVRHQELLRGTTVALARSAAWGETVVLFGDGMRAAYPACSNRMHHDVDLLAPDLSVAADLARLLRRDLGGHLVRGRLMRVRGWWLGVLGFVLRTADGYEVHVDLVAGGWPPVRGFPPTPATWVMRGARHVVIDGQDVRIPSPEGSLLLLTDRTIRKDPFRPNWFPDAMALLSDPDGLDWEEITERAANLHLAAALRRLLRMTELRAGRALVPAAIWTALPETTLDRKLYARIDAGADAVLTGRRPGWPELRPDGKHALKRLRQLWLVRDVIRPLGPRWGWAAQGRAKIDGRVFRRQLRFVVNHHRDPRSARILRLLRRGYGSRCELREHGAPPGVGLCSYQFPDRRTWAHLDADAKRVLAPFVALLPRSPDEVIRWTNKWGNRRHHCQNLTYHYSGRSSRPRRNDLPTGSSTSVSLLHVAGIASCRGTEEPA